MITSILSTKLYSPGMRNNNIKRKELVERLIQGINMNNKLTLVSAPAGYGKTTLIAELISTLSRTSAWISLDDGDNDITQFLSYVTASLRRAGIEIGKDTEAAVSDFNLSSTRAPLTMIINDIMVSSMKINLVLDDFHMINSREVIEGVKFLIEHQPPNFHLIIATREDPDLPLSKLRVQREILEIRMADLCFSLKETEEFFKQVMKLNLSSKALQTITARTEGWIAGLQLAGLTLSETQEQEAEEFIRMLSDTHRYIIDYLVEEVIGHQSIEVRDFLCKTSVLDRMNGELCDAVILGNNSKQLLYELEKANLFLIPLDSKREWYRYHHLFADSVRTELSKETEQLIHKRAALWLDGNGYKKEAVKEAFLSGDMQLSIRLVEENTEEAFKNAQLTTLLKWLDMLPEYLIKNNEILCVRKAWALYITGKMKEAIMHLDSLGEDFILKTTPHNKGLLLSLRALIAGITGGNSSEEQAEEALRFLEPWDPIARVSTLGTLGRAQEASGRIEEANDTFRKAYDEGRRLGFTFITTLALRNLGNNLNNIGKHCEAIELYINYIEGMTEEFGKPLPFIGVIYISLGEVYYRENEYGKAKFYIEKGIELCRSISYTWILNDGIMNIAEVLKRSGNNSSIEEQETLQRKKESIVSSEPDRAGYIEKLSQREIEILKLLTSGMSNNDIAKELYISINTTQWHISHIYAKLGVKSRTQAIVKAKELKIL